MKTKLSLKEALEGEPGLHYTYEIYACDIMGSKKGRPHGDEYVDLTLKVKGEEFEPDSTFTVEILVEPTNVQVVDNGIGPYEFWGQKDYDSQKDAEVIDNCDFKKFSISDFPENSTEQQVEAISQDVAKMWEEKDSAVSEGNVFAKAMEQVDEDSV